MIKRIEIPNAVPKPAHNQIYKYSIMLGPLLIMITPEELVLGVVMYTIVVSATGNIN